jgi:hypothetical protein
MKIRLPASQISSSNVPLVMRFLRCAQFTSYEQKRQARFYWACVVRNIRAECVLVKIGYARVSADGQSVAAQVDQLTEAGAEKMFGEKVSGAVTHRQQLERALDALGDRDVLLITRLDRLARSTRDLLNTLALIAEKKAGFRSLGDAWEDTHKPARTVDVDLAGLAEFQRELIRARTSEGRERAKANPGEAPEEIQAHAASGPCPQGQRRNP